MNRPVHALVLGLTLSLLASASFASVLEMKGSPEPNVATMPAYGMDVATRMGLKTVIPASWQLFVHRSVSLPETMNWNRGEAWPAVLTKFASDNQMAVLIDWDNHVVMLRSPEQALEEGATRQEIAQAAITPLPKFGDALPKAAKAPAMAQAQPDTIRPASAAASAELPTFNVVTAPEKALAQGTPVKPAAPAASATAPVAGAGPVMATKVLPASITPVPADKSAAPVAIAQVAPAKPALVASPVTTPAKPAVAPVVAEDAAKLAAVRQARAAEDAKLAALQKARSEEDAKLATAQKARESVSATLAATQKERDSLAAKLADAQKASEVEAAKLASTQKASEAEAAKLASLKKATEAETAKLEAAQAATKVAVAAVPVIRVNPTPAMVASQQEAAKSATAVKLASTDEFSYTAPVALNRPTARNVAQAIADRFNLRLVYAGEEFALRGPVTLLAESAQQDAHLLGRAIGAFGPVVLEVDNAQKILRVLPRNATPQQLAEIRARRPVVMARVPVGPAAATTALAPATSAPVLAKVAPAVTVNAVPAVVVTAPAPVAAQPAVAPAVKTAKPATDTVLTLELEARQPLEDSLSRFARAQDYTIEWKVSGGFEANRSMSFTGRTVREVLSQVLPKLGLSADIYTREKHIVVRPGDAALDR